MYTSELRFREGNRPVQGHMETQPLNWPSRANVLFPLSPRHLRSMMEATDHMHVTPKTTTDVEIKCVVCSWISMNAVKGSGGCFVT